MARNREVASRLLQTLRELKDRHSRGGWQHLNPWGLRDPRCRLWLNWCHSLAQTEVRCWREKLRWKQRSLGWPMARNAQDFLNFIQNLPGWQDSRCERARFNHSSMNVKNRVILLFVLTSDTMKSRLFLDLKIDPIKFHTYYPLYIELFQQYYKQNKGFILLFWIFAFIFTV